MLGQPEPVIAQPFRMPRQIEAVVQRLACCRAFDNRGQVQHGEFHHGPDIGYVPARETPRLSTNGAVQVTEAQASAGKGRAAAEISRGLFDVQLRFSFVFSARSGLPLAEVITWHTNLHRLFAYGNLSKQAPD